MWKVSSLPLPSWTNKYYLVLKLFYTFIYNVPKLLYTFIIYLLKYRGKANLLLCT